MARRLLWAVGVLFLAGCRGFMMGPRMGRKMTALPLPFGAQPLRHARPVCARGARRAPGVRMTQQDSTARQASVRADNPSGPPGGDPKTPPKTEPKLPEEAAGAKRRPTLLEQAATDDLDQAELELKLESLKSELQEINKKMIATRRRRRKLLKQSTSSKGQALSKNPLLAEPDIAEYSTDGAEFSVDGGLGEEGALVDDWLRNRNIERDDVLLQPTTFQINTFCTAEEYDMDVAFRRLRVWSRGNAKFMESGTVVHVRTGRACAQHSPHNALNAQHHTLTTQDNAQHKTQQRSTHSTLRTTLSTHNTTHQGHGGRTTRMIQMCGNSSTRTRATSLSFPMGWLCAGV